MEKDVFEQRVAVFAQLGVMAFLLCSFLMGGSSRADQPAQIGIRAVSIVMTAIALFFIRRQELIRARAPLLLLSALLGLMLLQIVPLPPRIWQSLPGRELAVSGSTLVGMNNVWRPLSYEPDITWNSILATLPGLCMILLLSMVRVQDIYKLIFVSATLALVSGILGLIQISSGQLYLYGVTNRGSAVGFFANRNHQAAMLTCLVPMMAFITIHASSRVPLGLRFAIAGALTLFIMPLVFITGSRTGMLLLLIGCAGALMLIRNSGLEMRTAFASPGSWQRRTFRAAPLALGVGVVVLVGMLIVSGRAIAINRVFQQDVEADARLRLFPTMADMTQTYFPVGTGFGTFPTMFKVSEPDWYLRAPYFNHAHNDWLEIVIEGGIFSLALMAAFAAWWTMTSVRLWAGHARTQPLAFGRLGSVMTLILMLASIVDYPLRTPLGQTLFLFALVLMARATEKMPSRRDATHSIRPKPQLRAI